MKKIRIYLKFVNYNRKFIQKFFHIAKSFTKFTKNNKTWIWIDNKQNIFQQLENAYLKKLILKIFDSKKSKRIKFDTLNLIIKICYTQQHDKKWHSITHLLKKLLLIEQNYDVHYKKLFAIIIILKTWKIYPKKFSKFTIFTNHKNLLYLTTIKQFNKKHMC